MIRFFLLINLFVGVWFTGLNMTQTNESDYSIHLQIAVCVALFCGFLERTIREGRE